jgi:hypothetical protein
MEQQQYETGRNSLSKFNISDYIRGNNAPQTNKAYNTIDRHVSFGYEPNNNAQYLG